MDAFSKLGLSPRLDLAEDQLRAAFREAGKRLHPDAGGTDTEFAAIQQAFSLLSSPSKRLKHWMELRGETGEDRGTISDGVMDLFGGISNTIQQVDILLRKREEARSALGLAMLETETLTCREAIEFAIEKVDHALARETALFPAIESGKVETHQAAQHVRNLAFLEKWRANLQERYSRLV